MDPEEREYMELFTSFIERFTQGMESFQYKGKNIGTNILLLNFIGKHPNCTMSDVKKYLKMIPSAATRRIDKLVNFGFVERIQDDRDRRLVRLALTQEGSELYQKFIQSRLYGMEMMKKMLKKEELEIFFKVLKIFSKVDPKLRTESRLFKDGLVDG